ncbi:hypothetical protein [Aurantiacibacter xanthus]|uniref:hypothetical protein n=1 Tax=Aurantiacibacter xanthus TaxID=1784712 RepID=UPI0011C214C1|nr:hypothetical protein [Aurantiacibacter xanthus]
MAVGRKFAREAEKGALLFGTVFGILGPLPPPLVSAAPTNARSQRREVRFARSLLKFLRFEGGIKRLRYQLEPSLQSTIDVGGSERHRPLLLLDFQAILFLLLPSLLEIVLVETELSKIESGLHSRGPQSSPAQNPRECILRKNLKIEKARGNRQAGDLLYIRDEELSVGVAHFLKQWF